MEDIPIQKMIFHGISSSMGYPPPPAPVAALPPRLPRSARQRRSGTGGTGTELGDFGA